MNDNTVREVASDRLGDALGSALDGLSNSDREIVLDLLKSSEDSLQRIETPSSPATTRRLERPLFGEAWYAIHDSDLSLLKEVVSTVLMVASGKHWESIESLIVLLFRYRKKRMRLNEHQGLVLRELIRAKGSGRSLEELERALGPASLTASHIHSVLDELQAIRKTDGTATALVRQQENRWYSVDV